LENTIREQDIRFREFLASANSLIVKLDPEGAVTFFNPHAQAFFGYSEAEILGKRLQDTLIPAGSRKDAPDFSRDTRLAREGPGLSITEMALRSGEPVWVAWTLSPIRDENGKLVEVVCIGHGITDHTHRDRRQISTAAWRDTVIAGTDVKDEVFDSVLHICVEIAREGREGKKLGTAFVVGDADAVLERSRQLILNPFEGHPPGERMVTNPDIKEMIKELAQLDGAFCRSRRRADRGRRPVHHRRYEQGRSPEGSWDPPLFHRGDHARHPCGRNRPVAERGQDLDLQERADRPGDQLTGFSLFLRHSPAGMRISNRAPFPSSPHSRMVAPQASTISRASQRLYPP